MIVIWFFLLSSLSSVTAWFYGRAEPDAWSTGGVWPLPQRIEYGRENRSLTPGRVTIDAGLLKNCDIISANVKRYTGKWLFPFPVSTSTIADSFSVTIRVDAACPNGVPQQDMDESYLLKVDVGKATLEASQVWGAVRGLETFSQLVYFDEAEKTVRFKAIRKQRESEKLIAYKVRTAVIHDFPRFSVRGVMIDSSRHFLSVNVIKRQLDLMSADKMNLLHWHLVDSEAFPFQSQRFPNLAAKGAYSGRHIYSPNDVHDIVQYARLRGIRVMPEFDTPGHTGAWKGQPGLLPECFDESGHPSIIPNAVDPTLESTYDFLAGLFTEIVSVFPERFIHLGGDEVLDTVKDCWKNNPKIAAYMIAHGMGNDTRLMEDYYLDRLQNILGNVSKNAGELVFWNEVFDNNKPTKDAIIHLWEDNWQVEMKDHAKRITAAGYRVIVSSCWYLNYIKYGADWKSKIGTMPDTQYRYYYCDPTDFDGTPAQKKLVLGGVAAIWGEFIDNTNLESIFWPRASAVSERLWSDPSQTTDADVAWPRLHELRCRLVSRGFRVSPNNFPDYCPYEFEEKALQL